MFFNDAVPTLKILRKVEGLSPAAIGYLNDEYLRRSKSIDPDTNRIRADVIHPSSGWIDNDLPRDEAITSEIMANSHGFAIASPTGQIVKTFADFASADKARQAAVVTFNVDVDVPDAEADDPGDGTLPFDERRPSSKPGR